MKIKTIICCLLAVQLSACTPNTNLEERGTTDSNTKPNIIFLIGDGMGLSQITTAFYYGDGSTNFRRFKQIGLITTHASNDKITDSAAGATAFSAGRKTYNGAIALDDNKQTLETLLELLSEQTYNAGLIATSSITHATPASYYAHVESRRMEEEIAVQMIKSEVDFFAGGGLQFFNKRTDSTSLLPDLEAEGFDVYTENLPLEVDNNKKQAILLADRGMPMMTEGRGDFLPNATKLAIDYLSEKEEPFFLMVEGSQIDWGGHANDGKYIIEETLDFDKSIGVAMDFAENNPNTLVVVTADHETGGFSLVKQAEIPEDQKQMNTDELFGHGFSTGGHSATLIPVFAFGPGADSFAGVYDNTDIFHKMLSISLGE